MIFKTLRGYRQALGVARARAADEQPDTGIAGAWDVELALSGLPERRREQLVAQLCAQTAGAALPPSGEGLLRCRGLVAGYSLQVACAAALSQFADALRRAGLDPAETLDSEFKLALAPNTASAARAHKTSKLGRLAYASMLCGAEAFDRGTRQRYGERSYRVSVRVPAEGLEGAERLFAMVKQWAEDPQVEVPAQPLALSGPDVSFEIDVRQVGDGLGALLLCVDKLRTMLQFAPANSAVELRATPRQHPSS